MTTSAYFLLILFYSAFFVCYSYANENDPAPKGAIVINLAGTPKLSKYFEWSCMSIQASSPMFDMIVFHEGHEDVNSLTCASNVIFVDLGEFGFSELVVRKILSKDNSIISEDARLSIVKLINNVITSIPRYIVELKPMTGEVFQEWLKGYSHWTYSDPDILWGNLCNWIDIDELTKYDVLTISKVMDAGRLFLRGQFSLHRNVDLYNTLWRQLEYFNHQNLIKRLGASLLEMKTDKTADEIFDKYFFSAEGIYSTLVFSTSSTNKQFVGVKIAGRAFDDYSRYPVVQIAGSLYRCSSYSLLECIPELILAWDQLSKAGVSALPEMVVTAAQSFVHETVCRMQVSACSR